MSEGNGWGEYKRLVISKLDDLTKKFDQLHKDNMNIKLEITRLKTVAMIRGGISGFFFGLLGTIIVSVILHNLLQ